MARKSNQGPLGNPIRIRFPKSGPGSARELTETGVTNGRDFASEVRYRCKIGSPDYANPKEPRALRQGDAGERSEVT